MPADPRNARRHPLLGSLLALLPVAALAQQPTPTAPQVTPRDLRPETAPQPAAELPQPAVRSVPPPNADKLFVRLGEVRVQGGYPEFAAETEALLAGRRGQRISVAQLYELGDMIEMLYREAGYPLARVVIPPQSVRDDAPVQFTVLDGFIESLNLDALPGRARAHVARLLTPLVGRRRVTDAELERALTLAGRGPGLSLRSALGAGKQAGGTVLVLQGALDTFVGSFSSDNRMSESIGPEQFTLQLRLNQPLGLGEQAYVYVSGGYPLRHAAASHAPRRVGGGGVIVPLMANGLSLNPEFTVSDTQPRSPIQELASRSQLRRASLRLIYPYLVSRSQELNLTAVLEASRQIDTLPYFNYTQSMDRLRVARFTVDWSGQLQDMQARAGLTLSQGSGRFGARSREDIAQSEIPMSRTGAGSAFTKLELNLGFDAALPWSLESRVSLRGQLPLRGVMPSAETFSMDGEQALSSLPPGALSNDGGWVLRQEVSRSLNLPGAVALSPYLFGAIAKPITRVPGAVAADFGRDYGLGLRAAWQSVRLAAEYGRGRVRPGGIRESQVYFNAQVQF
jgi:hemolysin activation/secretion protein